MKIRVSHRAAEVCLVLVSLTVGLVLVEALLQGRNAWARRQVVARISAGPPLHLLLDDPMVYGLNPEHPEISSQGLRNPEVVTPKPSGLWRILILGDSVTFGTDVRREEAYPAQLERVLNDQLDRPVEVINAGVSGYTPFNQLQYYRTRGRALQADVVVVGFCMNDVANPRLHWDYTNATLGDIPQAAIPNADYDRDILRARDSLINRSQLLTALKRRVVRLFAENSAADAGLPTFITGEDARLTIQVLLDQESPEWRWLTGMYDELHEAVVADGAQLVLVIFPLEYQLASDYPYLPQENLVTYCQSRSIAALDVLPDFRRHAAEGLFLQDALDVRDAWHLSVRGHRLTAELLAHELLARKRNGVALGESPPNGTTRSGDGQSIAPVPSWSGSH
jgi:lysophospholipase L1-like esterase